MYIISHILCKLTLTVFHALYRLYDVAHIIWDFIGSISYFITYLFSHEFNIVCYHLSDRYFIRKQSESWISIWKIMIRVSTNMSGCISFLQNTLGHKITFYWQKSVFVTWISLVEYIFRQNFFSLSLRLLGLLNLYHFSY